MVLGILLFLGLLGAKVSNRLKFPMVTGFIVVGMLLSPSVLGVLSREIIEEFSIITDVALSIVAFIVGGSLSIRRLKRLSKQILWITMVQASLATIFVIVLILLLIPNIISLEWNSLVAMALVLGAISAATAPAATLAIVHEYRAKGPLTTTLLAIVALDDAVCIIYFIIAMAFANTILAPGSMSHLIFQPLVGIIYSILLGASFSVILYFTKKIVRGSEEILTAILGLVFLVSGFARLLDADPLLANMVFGFIVENYVGFEESFTVLENIENVIFALFFTLAGTHFDPGLMMTALPLTLIMTIGRFSGKCFGSYVGGLISKAPEALKKYVGLGLLPQAGVTVGLILFAAREALFEPFISIALNATLAAVIINELIAPPLTKYAIFKAGEAYKG